MKKITFIKTFVLLFALIGAFTSAQNITGKTTKVVVSGTSPMHDWIMTSTNSTFMGTVAGNAITNVKFSMPAKNLKSEKGKMMDNKAYNALKADQNPNITFYATSMNVGKGTLSGKLTIAGVTKTVSLPVTVVKNGTSYNINGSSSMKMSDFGMQTPGFLGVHTGDAITVTVNVVAN